MLKISEIKGEDKVLPLIAELIMPVANIAADEEAKSIFVPQTLPDGMTPGELLLENVKKCVPVLIERHRDDLVTILAALSDRGKEEYSENMTIMGVAHDFIELLGDKDVRSFFY